MIKHILFDIDDTLFPSTEFSSLARKNALNAMISMGLDHPYPELESSLEAIIKKKGSNYPGHFDDLCKALGIKDSGKYIASAVAAYHDTKTSIAPFPKVPLTLLKLKEKGYHLHIATQGSSIKQWDKLIRLRIALYFDRVFVSEEMNEDKSAGFYKKILAALQSSPQECMMVGDREDSDILPAKDAGFKTVRILSGKYATTPTKAEFVIKDIDGLIAVLNEL